MRRKALALLLALAALLTCLPALAEDTLTLPAALKVIGEEAFLGSTARRIVLPEGLEEIHSRAFSGAAVEDINLPLSLRSIADDAFDTKPSGLSVILGSWAYDWAVAKGWMQAVPELAMGETQLLLAPQEKRTLLFTAPETGCYRLTDDSRSTRCYPSVRTLSGGYRYGIDGDDGQSTYFELEAGERIQIAISCYASAETVTHLTVSRFERTHDAVVDSGACGSSMTWSLRADDTLVIEGSGAMTDYAWDSSAPWRNLYGSNSLDRLFRIRRVEIGEGVQTIGNEAFSDCVHLERVSLPDSLQSIGVFAFKDCELLDEVTLPAGLTALGESAFIRCSSLRELAFPQGIAAVPPYALMECISLTRVSLPAGVQSIGASAFYGCYNLETVAFAGTGTQAAAISIGPGNNGLSELPWACASGSFAYSFPTSGSCGPSLTWSISDDGTLTIAGSGTMDDFDLDPPWEDHSAEITAVRFSGSVAAMSENAFQWLVNLRSVAIPGTMQSVAFDAFRHCSGLKRVVLGEGIQRIEGLSFMYCDSLEELVLPASLTYIDACAFDSCPKLKDIYYAGSSAQAAAITIDRYNEYADFSAFDAAVWHYGHRASGSATQASLGTASIALDTSEQATLQFTAPVAGIYRFETLGSADTYGSLYDSAMNLLAENDDGIGPAFRIDRMLTAGQKVYVRVRFEDSDASGEITLSIANVTPTPTPPPPVHTAQLGANPTSLTAGQHCIYSFTAPAAGNYLFYSSGTLDTFAILYNASRVELARNDDGGAGTNFHIEQAMEAGEQILLEAYFYNAAVSGTFDVHVDQVLATPTPTPRPAPITGRYRALIIGNAYANSSSIGFRPAGDLDRVSMAHMLQSMSATPYSVTMKRDLTASQIISAIGTAFKGAKSDDVSLFYFSGHGFTGSGSLVGTDQKGVSAAALRNAMDKIPGKKIVLINCCFSGHMINRSSALTQDSAQAEVSDAELKAFNRQFIQAFSGSSSSESSSNGLMSRSGELAAGKYYVLTSSSKNEPSWRNDSMGSFFTYCLEYGSGWNESTDRRINSLYADKNADGYVSLSEAYNSVEYYLDYFGFRTGQVKQHTQIYPSGSSFILWGR
ncbi:MAG: leucine-rich repeat protein [Candidatus Ventricola sp.]